MSIINDSVSQNNDGKSSKLIIISKSRLASAKEVPNFMTIYEGKHKITCDIGKENINKKQLKKTFSTLKEAIMKYSNSTGQLNPGNKQINIFPKKNKLNISKDKEKKYVREKKQVEKTLENCHVLTTNENYIDNGDEIQVIDDNNSDNLSNKEKKKETLETNNVNNIIKVENDNDNNDSFDLNLEGLKIINIEQINNDNQKINSKNNINLISQNYFNNIKQIKNKPEDKHYIYKSEEVQKPIKKQKSDKAVKSMSEYISKQSQNVNVIESEKSENKNNYLNLNKKSRNKNIINSLITEERQLNIEEDKKDISSHLNNEEEKNTKNNKNKINSNRYVIETIEDDNYFNCSICEYSFIESQMFIPECQIHYLCKKCTKNYYEELIDDGIKELFCPFFQCKKGINLEKLKSFISQQHYTRLKLYNRNLENLEENKLVFSRFKTDNNKQYLELYSKKHVLDVNSNKIFYKYKGVKDYYCPFCNEESLFTFTNNHFYKCLNCLSKVCKYCFKEYNYRHIDINNPERCKVYLRDIYYGIKQNNFYTFLIQLFLVLAMYYFTFAGTFILLRNKFLYLFNTNQYLISCKLIIVYIFTIVIFIVLIPFIFVLYPYFPSISTIFDY